MLSFTLLLFEELQRLFPSIPLVAEEDSASLRSSEADGNSGDVLVESICSAVADKVSISESPLTRDNVLRAIDRGGQDAVSFNSSPATYWVSNKLPCIIYHKSRSEKLIQSLANQCLSFVINMMLWFEGT
jgi:3'-phosphoadenosine 5'-phosphosulfate (PAPS) 3'-phosphatase